MLGFLPKEGGILIIVIIQIIQSVQSEALQRSGFLRSGLACRPGPCATVRFALWRIWGRAGCSRKMLPKSNELSESSLSASESEESVERLPAPKIADVEESSDELPFCRAMMTSSAVRCSGFDLSRLVERASMGGRTL